MDPITIMSTTTPPTVPPIITPVEAAPVPCAICAVWDPVGAVLVSRPITVESLEAERLANVP